MDSDNNNNPADMARKLLAAGKYAEAAKHYTIVINNDASCTNHWVELAIAFQGMGQINKSVQACQQAFALAPDDPLINGNLGSFLQQSGDMDGAEIAYLKAIEINPSFVDALYNLGYLYTVQRKRDEAISCFKRVLELKPDHENAIVGLAAMLERQGETEQAYHYLQPLINTMGCSTFALINFAQICGSLGRSEEAITPLESQLKKSQLPQGERLQLHFALGKLLDKQGKYQKAFKHYKYGNDLTPTTFDIGRYQTKIANTIQSYSPTFMKNTIKATNRSKVPVFIIATPRSGTTLIEQILSSHPQIYGAGETGKIAENAAHLHTMIQNNSITTEKLDAVAMQYLGYLESASGCASRVVDKSVNNFMDIGLIRMLFPEAHIIHCIRNPLDTCLSCYFSNLGSAHPYSYKLEDLAVFYNEYHRMMEHWKNIPKLSILEIHYEDLVRNLETGARSMINFIGLEWDSRCLDFHKTERQVSTISYDQVRRPIYTSSTNRWKNYETELKPLINALNHNNSNLE